MRDGRERKAYEPGKDDRPRRILLDKMAADGLRVDADRLDAHEVAGIERHHLEEFRVPGIFGEDAADEMVAAGEDFVLLALLRGVGRVGERGGREVLAERGNIGDAAPDVARRLRLERLQLRFRRALERKRDEADAKPPDVILLRGAVELDGEDVFVKAREIGEERFAVDALLVDEPEVRIVEDDYDFDALLGRFLDGLDNRGRVFVRGRVAGGVVGEVEDQDFLGAVGKERGLERRRVETAILERVEMRNAATGDFTEYELVVVPEKIGRDERIRMIGEELGRDAQAVGDGVRHDGARIEEAAHGRVFLQFHLHPLLAQGGQPERACIQEDRLVHVDARLERVHHERRAVFLERLAYRCVDFRPLGLGALPEDAAVGEIHPLADGGKEFRRGP